MKYINRLLLATIFAASLIYSFEAHSQEWKEYLDKSDLALNAGDYPVAMENARKSLELAEAELGKKHVNCAVLHGRVAQIYYMSGDYDSAIKYMRIEITMKRDILGKTSPGYAAAIHNLSAVYQTLGRYREAAPLLKEAVEIKKELKGEKDSSYAKSLHSLALNCQSLGSLEEAEKYYLMAVNIKKETMGRENVSYGKTIVNLGNLAQTLGNYERAAGYFEEATGIFSKIYGKSHPETVQAESKLASLYLTLGEKEKASRHIKSLEAIQKSGVFKARPEYAQALYNLGMVNWSLGKMKKAEDLILKSKGITEKAFGQANPLYSSCLNVLGAIKWANGDYETAHRYFSEAVYLKEQLFGEKHPDYVIVLHNLAGILKELGQYSLAEEKYEKAYYLYKKQLKDYFPFLSENEKAKFYAKIKEKFDLFYCYVAQRHKENPELAGMMFNHHMSIKASLLNSQKKVRESILGSGDSALINKYQRWIDTRYELSRLYHFPTYKLNSLGKNPDSLENIANALEKEISLKSGSFEKEYENREYTWQQARDSLKEGEAAVEIVRFNFFQEGSWVDTVIYAALILRKDSENGPEIIFNLDGKELETSAYQYYSNNVRERREDVESYRRFWAEIDKKLEGCGVVYLSQDGVYNLVNVSGLMNTGGSFVIDEKKIVHISSSKSLLEKAPRRPSNKNAVLFGYPDYEYKSRLASANQWKGLQIPELPGSVAEIDKIRSILNIKKWNVETYTEGRASEENFKRIKGARLIHIATHGFFNNKGYRDVNRYTFGFDDFGTGGNPLLNSALLLSGAAYYFKNNEITEPVEGENGILTAYEAMNLNLEDTELLVLSACETGLGAIKIGEGVYGLQRAFLVAGSEYVIMSLWKVNDEATQELMAEFYKHWLGGVDIYSAFRMAQLKIKEKYHNPYFWAQPL